MSIDWAHFTPWSAFGGGLLIGFAAAMLAVMNARIAGISSIVGGMLGAVAGERLWRLAFIAGLVVAAPTWQIFALLPHAQIEAGFYELIIAGLLVGVGTRYAGGCTSGHGVCGLARLSLRSLVATLCFMATGFIAVYTVRHLIGR